MFKKFWKMEEAEEGSDLGEGSLDTRDIISREMDKLEPEVQPEEAQEQPEEKKRDEKGKFAPKEEKAEEPQAEESEGEESSEDSQDAEEPEAQQEEKPKERDPWNSWKPKYVEEIKKLPQEAQEYILQRQDQFHKGIQQYRDEANYARTIKKAVAQYEPYMAQLGVTPEVAFASLLKTEHTLRTADPEKRALAFRQLAHDYGVDLNSVAQQNFDPNMYRMEKQLSQLQSQLQASQTSQQSAEEEQIGSALEQFAQSHEYYEEVRETMADLLERSLATNLDDAYAKAVRLNDDVFAQVQAKQQADAERRKLAQGNQAAQAAKAAAVSVKGAPTGVSHSKPPATTEEAVRLAMAKHGI